MLSQRDHHRVRAIARLAPRGPTIVVAASPRDDALEVAALALASGRQRPVAVVGPFNPVALRRPDLYGRIRATIGDPVGLARLRCPPVPLIYLSGRAALRPYAGAWARHVRAGGYLALWAGAAARPQDLGVTPAYWDLFTTRGGIQLVRRRSVG